MINEEIKLDENAVEMLKETVGGGGEATAYYRHVVYCAGTGVEGCFSGEFQLDVINTDPMAFNFTSLVDFLNTNGYTFEHPYPCQVDTNTDGLHLGTCRYQDNTVYTTMGGIDALYIDDQDKENLVDFVVPFFVVPVND